MKPRKKAKYNSNSVIRGALRRAFSRSPVVREVREASRKEVARFKKDGTRHKKNLVFRQCEVCETWCPNSQIQIDHIEPVVSTDDGFLDWNTFISRLGFESKENLQRICKSCHALKTARERALRKERI